MPFPTAPNVGDEHTESGNTFRFDGAWYLIDEPDSGPTVDRPAAPIVGQTYFDTDIGQPVTWDGAAWVPRGAGIRTWDGSAWVETFGTDIYLRDVTAGDPTPGGLTAGDIVIEI